MVNGRVLLIEYRKNYKYFLVEKNLKQEKAAFTPLFHLNPYAARRFDEACLLDKTNCSSSSPTSLSGL
jgi:hypothetical protein